MATDLLPRYYQIKQVIKKWIINDEIGMGKKIPSENELASSFHVSRLTVRQALSQLIQEGFLTSRRGDGTYVTDNAKLLDSYNLEFSGFMDDLFYQITRSKTKSVEIKLKKLSDEKFFGITKKEFQNRVLGGQHKLNLMKSTSESCV